MKWLAFILFAAAIAGVGFYVYDHNQKVDAAAASNNGATCVINIQMDDELYALWAGGDVSASALGSSQTTQSGGSFTTDTNVTTTLPSLITEMQTAIAELELIAGAACTPVVSKFPAMTPGRLQIGIEYYRPYPLPTPTGETQ